MESQAHGQFLTDASIESFVKRRSEKVLPNKEIIEHGEDSLIQSLPDTGLGYDSTISHINNDILPALNGSSRSTRYYGFVTGGSTPAATYADHIVSIADQNAAADYPTQTITSQIEQRALELVLDLLDLSRNRFLGRTLTTGCTASNVLGFACGRQYIFEQAAFRQGLSVSDCDIAEYGLVQVCQKLEIGEVQILTTAPHGSVLKAASLLGIGRRSVHVLPLSSDEPWRLDFVALEQRLQTPKTVSIISLSCGEVNAGFYASTLAEEMLRLRSLCDKYGAWLHVDGAFGIFARLLPDQPEYQEIRNGAAGMDLADSIAADAHKLLNVPYDCGLFFTRNLTYLNQVFTNKPASSPLTASNPMHQATPSPLNIGLENSRRFRALPLYATLYAYGKDGYRDMLIRQVSLARKIAAFIDQHASYDLLPLSNQATHSTPSSTSNNSSRAAELPGHSLSISTAPVVQSATSNLNRYNKIFIIVLFRAKDETLNTNLNAKINETSKIYTSGTIWSGQPATRIAVANWNGDVERDYKVVCNVLDQIARDSLPYP